MAFETLLLFLVASLLLNMTPGPDTLNVVTASARGGVRAGLLCNLGIVCGTCVHILLAAFGAASLIAASAFAFTLLKLVGVLYLFYLGLGYLRRAWMTGKGSDSLIHHPPPALDTRKPDFKSFTQGFLTNVLNPKVALFFLAFVPQFIPDSSTNVLSQFLLLGALFNLSSFIWSGVLTLVTVRARAGFQNSHRLKGFIQTIVGMLFVSLGLKLLLESRA